MNNKQFGQAITQALGGVIAKNDYNAMQELADHRAKYGTNYRTPDGHYIRLTAHELPAYLKARGLQVHTPSEQGNSIEAEQVGIKHS